MTKLLLSIHVLAAIVAIGPVTVAASMFPATLRRGDRATMRLLHRICRVYAAVAVVVPVFGVSTAVNLGVLGDAWLLASIALTVAAAAILGLRVLPAQAEALRTAATPADAAIPADAAATALPTTGGTLAGGGPSETVPSGTGRYGIGTALTGPSETGVAGTGTAGTGTAGTGVAVAARRLGMLTGVFNLLWAVVVVLMIVRPGSTTGA